MKDIADFVREQLITAQTTWQAGYDTGYRAGVIAGLNQAKQIVDKSFPPTMTAAELLGEPPKAGAAPAEGGYQPLNPHAGETPRPPPVKP